MKLRATNALVAAAILAVTAAGCGAKSAGSQGQPAGSVTDSLPVTPSDTEPPADTDTASASDTPSDTVEPSDPVRSSKPAASKPTSRPPIGLAACAAPSLRAVARTAGAATSHEGQIIVYTNGGQIACAMTGYPGLAIVNSAGKQLIQAGRTPSGYLGGIRNGKPPFPTVVLNAGQSASALLEGLAFDAATGKGCPTEPALLTTPPGSTVSIRLAVSTHICSQVQIHPVVPGTTGSGN